MLYIYNTLTQTKERFKPLQAGKVGLYVCGMTAYDHCHLGHARVMLVFDMICRYLRHLGFEVNYVRNITDIDDKILQRAQENQEPYTALTQRIIASIQQDLATLAILPPTSEPRATHYIPHMLNLIQILLDKGYAYIAANGDVCYAVTRFKSAYGTLNQQTPETLQHGARIAIDPLKRNPLDFALWKRAKADEPSWDSPWGLGRPGWHIECSTMALHCLGPSFDIHGGGLDLRFPHHHNEIAQSEAITGQRFVNCWVHVGFVQINQKKMSKSLGNQLSLHQVLAHYPAEVLRYFLLASHYRSPIQYSEENLQTAQATIRRLYTALRGLIDSDDTGISFSLIEPIYKQYWQRFQQAMNDDFNVPSALAVLFELSHTLNQLRSEDLHRAKALAKVLKQLGDVLGILQQDPATYLMGTMPVEVAKIEQQIMARHLARQNKDWATADRIRAALLQQGITLEDTAEGSVWRQC